MIRLTRPPCPNAAALTADYKHPDNKAALRAASHDKCMYCESKVSHVYYGDVEHIRPRARFPHLECEWTNLGFVCARCNGAKRDKWSEETAFINPYDEDPEEHLAALGAFIYQRNGSERGEYTWRELELNRPDLLECREARIGELRTLIDKIRRTGDGTLRGLVQQELQAAIADSNPYTLVCRTAVQLLRRDGGRPAV